MKKIVNKGKGEQPKLDRNTALAKDYKRGMSVWGMTSKYKISSARIYKILRMMGIKRNRVIVGENKKKDRNEQIAQDYKNGMTIPEIASKYKIAVPTVYKFIELKG